MKRRRSHVIQQVDCSNSKIIRKKRGRLLDETYAEPLQGVVQNLPTAEYDWNIEDSTARDSVVISAISDTFDSITQEGVPGWPSNNHGQLVHHNGRRQRSGDSLSEILDDLPFTSEPTLRDRSGVTLAPSQGQHQDNLRRRFFLESDLLDCGADTVIESPDKTRFSRKGPVITQVGNRRGRVYKTDNNSDSFSCNVEFDDDFEGVQQLSPAGFSPIRLRHQRLTTTAGGGNNSASLSSRGFLGELHSHQVDTSQHRIEVYDDVDDFSDGVFDSLGIPSDAYIDDQIVEMELSAGGDTPHYLSGPPPLLRHQPDDEVDDDEEFVFADDATFSPGEFLESVHHHNVNLPIQQQQQHQVRQFSASGGRRRKSPLKPIEQHHSSGMYLSSVVPNNGISSSSGTCVDLDDGFSTVGTTDDYGWHTSSEHSGNGPDSVKDPFDSPVSPAYLARCALDSKVRDGGTSPGQTIYKRTATLRRPAILRGTTASPSTQGVCGRVLMESAVSSSDQLTNNHQLSDLIFSNDVITASSVAITSSAPSLAKSVNNNVSQTRTASANLLQKRQAARQQQQIPIISSVGSCPPSSVLQDKIQISDDQSSSSVDVTDFSSFNGSSSALYWSEYEPQIKERKEKVITQDMIDQRPRQAIRKYYSALKKHLSRQERKCVSPVPFYQQQSNNEGVSNQQSSNPVAEPPVCSSSSTATNSEVSSVQNSSAAPSTGRRPIQNLGHALQELRSRTSGSRSDQYKVIVVDDPNGRQEAVLVSNPPSHLAAQAANTYRPNPGVNTNTAGQRGVVQSARIKGQSARSLLKEIRVVTMPDGTVRKTDHGCSMGPPGGDVRAAVGPTRPRQNRHSVVGGVKTESSVMSVRRQTQVKLMTYCHNGDTVAMNL